MQTFNGKVAMTGSGGFIGAALSNQLRQRGYQVLPLVRNKRHPALQSGQAVYWDPQANAIDSEALEGVDALIHLGGESLLSWRWTAEKKLRILSSRVVNSEFLIKRCSRLRQPPRYLISASAIGYYGSRHDEILTESSSPGSGFLANVCQQWEGTAFKAQQFGMTVSCLRLGLVFAARGGILQRLLTPYRLGLGGPVGDGKQYQSWIALDDVVGAVIFLLQKGLGKSAQTVNGAFNLTAPAPVTQGELNKRLGEVLHRPAFMPLPKFVVRILLGEMGQELLLSSARVLPQRLLDLGYQFQYPELAATLRHLLK